MKLSTTIIFTVLLFFSINAFAINLSSSKILRRSVLGIARESIRKTNKRFVQSFRELEEALGISEPDLASWEILSLRRAGFNPVALQAHSESSDEILQIVESRFLDSVLTLRWWGNRAFRERVFYSITKKHFEGRWGWELLLKWWEEAKLGDEAGRLEDWMASSFKAVESYNVEGREVLDLIENDKFLSTVFRAVGENEDFRNEVGIIINMALRRVYPREGLDLMEEGTGVSQRLRDGPERDLPQTVDPSWREMQDLA